MILSPDLSRAEALRRLRAAFAQAGLDSPALDARVLLAEALGITASELVLRPEAPLGSAAGRLGDWAARRLAREPVSRILGEREFWGLPFALSPGTLVPRPDTETVVETALSLIPPEPASVLDLGTGSGCLLVALLHERPDAWGLGVDRSLDALRTARSNAARNGVAERARFVAADWAAPLAGRFSLIVSNPPYIPCGDLAALDPEVRAHDPVAALDGGPDGLDAYRAILAASPTSLAPGGLLVLELGIGQSGEVSRLATDGGWRVERLAPDLAGVPRALALRRESRENR